MNLEDVAPASYRNVEFFVARVNTSGGRKDSKKEIADSDKQVIEDMGLKQRIFTVNGIIAARRDVSGNEITSYQDSRDSLLEALELGERGILVHPFYGEIENVVARTFSLDEDLANLGDSPITIVFEISNADGQPKVTEHVLSFIESATQFTMDRIELDIELNYSIWTRAAGNFQDAIDKANSITVAIREATDPLVQKAEEINTFSSGLAEFSENIASLVMAPIQLADSIIGLIDSVKGIHTSAVGAYKAFVELFDFGDDDVEIDTSTFGQINRQNNRDRINFAIQAGSLSQAYFSASKMLYDTVDEIDAVANELEIQYLKLFTDEDIDADTIDALTELRRVVEGFFNEQKLKASRVITIRTDPISIRSLAFKYYGESTLGNDIGDLNGFADGSYVSGNVDIFTQ
jgi:prophage DNA circulation protein